jgi:hypothetical protein
MFQTSVNMCPVEVGGDAVGYRRLGDNLAEV